MQHTRIDHRPSATGWLVLPVAESRDDANQWIAAVIQMKWLLKGLVWLAVSEHILYTSLFARKAAETSEKSTRHTTTTKNTKKPLSKRAN